MSESNLARSLFSDGKGLPLRKKTLQTNLDEMAIVSQTELSAQEKSSITDESYLLLAEATIEPPGEQTLETNPENLNRAIADLSYQYEAQRTYIQQLEAEISQIKSVQSGESKILTEGATVALSEIRQRDLERLAAQQAQIEQLQRQEMELETLNQQLVVELDKAMLSLVENTQTVKKLQTQLMESNSRRDELEAQLLKQLSIQTVQQQSLQVLETDYGATYARLHELEQQVTELQEQVLKQAGQAAEYEAAVQHWKDQALNHQRHALQLSGALDRFLESKSAKKSTPDPATKNEEKVAAALPDKLSIPPSTKTANKIDLPAFLVRQR